ncbi:lipoprotein [Ideonella sp.]
MVAAGLLVGLLQACGQRGPLVLPSPAKAASASTAAASAPGAPR